MSLLSQYLVLIGLLAALYAMKTWALRHFSSRGVAAAFFFLGLAVLLLGLYALQGPYPKGIQRREGGWWLGNPVMLFTVPVLSFGYDLLTWRGRAIRIGWGRLLIEVVALVPLWAFIWIFVFELLILHWIWW